MLGNCNHILLSILLLSFASNGFAENRIIITFENMPSLNQEADLIKSIENYTSAQKLQRHLAKQNWVDQFLIKRSFFGTSVQAFIKSKKPQYVWKGKFYLDQKLSKFTYDGGYLKLIRLNMPLEYLASWVNIETQYLTLLDNFNLTLESANFEPVIGWYFITNNSLRINLGDDLSNDTYQKLSLTFKYMFENNLTPSIIDLRYKAGAALNYGK
jgi:hypothetical protein